MVGKIVAVAAILMVIGAGLIFAQLDFMESFFAEEGKPIGVALGNETEDTVEMHIVVTNQMTTTNPPPYSDTGTPLWDEWAKEHIIVEDSSGQGVALTRQFASNLIEDTQAGPLKEFIVVAELKRGEEYAFTFDASDRSPIEDQHRTLTAEPQKFMRMRMTVVK